MAQVLARVKYERGLPLLTIRELNEAYARLDERYNCYRSNWEWFTSVRHTPEDGVWHRVEQN